MIISELIFPHLYSFFRRHSSSAAILLEAVKHKTSDVNFREQNQICKILRRFKPKLMTTIQIFWMFYTYC